MSVAPYTLSDLVSALNLDAIRSQYLAGLQGAGFPALTQWVAKAGVEMSYVDMVSGSATDLIAADLPFLIAGGFLGKAAELGADRALDLLGETVYLLPRVAATSTTFNMTLSCAATAGPYTLDPGDVQIIAPSGNRYVSTTGGTLDSDGAATIAFQAIAPGASYADDPSLGGFTLGTTLAGVTIAAAAPDFSDVVLVGAGSGQLVPTLVTTADLLTSLAHGAGTTHTYVARIDTTGDAGAALWSLSTDGGPFAGQGVLQASNLIGNGIAVLAVDGNTTPSSFVAGNTYTWRSPGGPKYVQGSDAESNIRYAARCRARWPSLSQNPTRGLIRLWISLVAPQASRVRLSVDPIVPARVLAQLADSHGPADQNLVNAVVAFIGPRIGPFSSIAGAPAPGVIITAAGSVTVTPSTRAAVQAAAQEAWVLYLGGLDLGSTVRLAELVRLLEDAGASVRDPTALSFNNVFANLTLPVGAVPVPASLGDSMTWVYG
jgi:hypothetical protein